MAKTARVTQHVFATLTFKREIDKDNTWLSVTRMFNRFVTNYRRLHRDGCEYIRTVEAHKDGYPHIHAVLQHKHGVFVTNNRYFDSDLYQKWKGLWKSGFSDFQAPYAGNQYPILYIVKYISKSSTSKTLWKKMYKSSNVVTAKDTSAVSVDPSISPIKKPLLASPNTETNPTLSFCKQYKIKQCTWSRGFMFPSIRPKSLIVLPHQETLNNHFTE